VILFLLESSTVFHHDIWLCDIVTVTCDIMLALTLSLKIRIKEKEKENKK